MGHSMDVFHLRWTPGEYLDEDILSTIPMFWFKKFNWTRDDVEKLYNDSQIGMTKKIKRELDGVFGKKKSKKKRQMAAVKASYFGADGKMVIQSEKEELAEVNKNDMYRRTRRLLKKVDAVPSKVRAIDNQSEVNINSAEFPDLSFISAQLGPINDEQEISPGPALNGSDDEKKDGKTLKPMVTTGNLKDINEDQVDTPTAINMEPITPITPLSPNVATHRSTNSITTPHGDMDTNTMINLRNKHRRTSSLMRRTSSEFSMKIFAEIVWNKLAVVSGRGDTLTQRQFDIELEKNNILGDPDICKDLFKTIQSENPVNKKQINKDDFHRVCDELDKIPLVKEIANDTLKKNEDEKTKIVLKQVFVHIAQEESFDIAAYLSVKLSASDLNNVELLLEYISSRQQEWTTRLQILEWITANLENSEKLRALTNDDNIGPFLLGWMCQCLDERSNLAKAALEMFPNVLSIAMTQTGEAFQFLDDIFSSLFLVLRNKRSKDLNQTADECCIQCVDMIMDWHEHGQLDNEVLLEICCIFRDNTNAKEMKHDKVRERCVAYFGYILYGIHGNDNNGNKANGKSPDTPDTPERASTPTLNVQSSAHIKAKSMNYMNGNDDEDEKWVPVVQTSFVGQKDKLKISKVMKRKYLLEQENDKSFIEYMQSALDNGLNDKSGDTRTTTFKLLEKLQKEENGKEILEEILKVDKFGMSKFNKWRERKNKGKGGKNGGKSGRYGRSRNGTISQMRKKSNKKGRIKKHNKNEMSVALTIGAQ